MGAGSTHGGVLQGEYKAPIKRHVSCELPSWLLTQQPYGTMDAVEKANTDKQTRWCTQYFQLQAHLFMYLRAKERKVGEGTYAVVYQGLSWSLFLRAFLMIMM